MYTCQVCNYSTKNASSYKRHLESLKHKKKLESLCSPIANIDSSKSNSQVKTVNIDIESKAIAALEEKIKILIQHNKTIENNYNQMKQEQLSMKKRMEKIGKYLSLVCKASNEINPL